MNKFRKDFSERNKIDDSGKIEKQKTSKMGKILNIARKIGLALGITGTVATTAVYADVAYNNAEISNHILKMLKSEDKSEAPKTAPQNTFEQTRDTTTTSENTKKPTDPKTEPTEGGGEPDEDENTDNKGFSPEKPEQKDTIKTENVEPKEELRAKAEINEDEINWDEADWEGSDESLKEADKDLEASQNRVKNKKNTIADQNQTKKVQNEAITEIDERLETKRKKIAELEGKKGE